MQVDQFKWLDLVKFNSPFQFHIRILTICRAQKWDSLAQRCLYLSAIISFTFERIRSHSSQATSYLNLSIFNTSLDIVSMNLSAHVFVILVKIFASNVFIRRSKLFPWSITPAATTCQSFIRHTTRKLGRNLHNIYVRTYVTCV